MRKEGKGEAKLLLRLIKPLSFYRQRLTRVFSTTQFIKISQITNSDTYLRIMIAS
jgi:hypothetical protein